jgi:hypothetical protein
MAMTFDATLKDMGRDSPQGFLATFDRPPTAPVKLLNVDLSTVTTAADVILGLGDTSLAILDEGQEKGAQKARREDIIEFGGERLGPCDEATRSKLSGVVHLGRLKRMVRCAAKAANWQEIVDTK